MKYECMYKADLAGVALKLQESRVIASWMLEHPDFRDEESWNQVIFKDNQLQIRGLSTLRRQSNLLRARLAFLQPEMLAIVAQGSFRESVQACLSAAIKHSRLLGDFMDIALRKELESHNRQITPYQWRVYLEGCHERDPGMTEWSGATSTRIRTTVFSILQDAGYLIREKNYVLQDVRLEDRIVRALEAENETYCLKCMRLNP